MPRTAGMAGRCSPRRSGPPTLRRRGPNIEAAARVEVLLREVPRLLLPSPVCSMRWLSALRARARALKREMVALYLAGRDPRTPWPARLVAALVVGYAFSPIDLIPDFIPVLGLLDDLVLLPLGVALVLRMIPDAVMADARTRAETIADRPTSRVAAVVIVLVWLFLAAWALAALWPRLRG